MSDELTREQKLELARVTPSDKEGKVIFDVCHLTVKDKRIVAECESIEASEELALLLSEEVFIRVKPVKVTGEPEPVPEF
ncbi:hypothetical protein ES705_44090 [subsurface metagenome]